MTWNEKVLRTKISKLRIFIFLRIYGKNDLSRNNQNMNQPPEKHTSIAFTTFTEQIKTIPGYDEIEKTKCKIQKHRRGEFLRPDKTDWGRISTGQDTILNYKRWQSAFGIGQVNVYSKIMEHQNAGIIQEKVKFWSFQTVSIWDMRPFAKISVRPDSVQSLDVRWILNEKVFGMKSGSYFDGIQECLVHFGGESVIDEDVGSGCVRSKCPDGSGSEQIPVVLELEELAQLLPVPRDTHHLVLQVLRQPLLKRLRDHRQLVLLVRSLREALERRGLHHCLTERHHWVGHLQTPTRGVMFVRHVSVHLTHVRGTQINIVSTCIFVWFSEKVLKFNIQTFGVNANHTVLFKYSKNRNRKQAGNGQSRRYI